ncbi:MAG: DNRLRE domain-containing protein, partial [Clostridia bacterium]|nr:DNRLRE domain-containing protein [Clostridia bacterium]
MLKSKLKIKVIAFVLTLTTLVMSLPLYAYTGIFEAGDSVASALALNSGAEETSEIYVLSENETLRDENTKHFLLSDGTSRAVVYSQSVHYRDDDGKWTHIDNTLTESGSEYSTDNKTKIKFANKSGSSGLVSINNGSYKIEFTPLGTNKVEVVIENPEKNNSRKFEDMSRLNGLTSKATYANIYDGIDIEYILSGNNIKENIIVNEEKSSYIFSFELKLNGLTAMLEDEKILLSDIDTAELIYEIPAPFMYDDGGEYSDAVTYTLTQSSKWKYTLTVEADAEWINTDGRAFPVTIDPQLVVGGRNNVEDTTTYTTDVSGTYGDSIILGAGGSSTAYWRTNFIPTIPASSYITWAAFSLEFAGAVRSAYARLGVFKVISDWSENTLSYASFRAGEGRIDENTYSTITYLEGEQLGPNTWNVTEIVKSWYDGTSSNYGFAVKEIVSGESVNGYRYYSSEYTFSDESPFLVISYKDLAGLEDYMSYTSQNVGLAGNGYVNNATGHLTFTAGTMGMTDNLFGFTPTLVYNQRFARKSVLMNTSGNITPYSSEMLGYGFKMNIHEFVYKGEYKDENGLSRSGYIWNDSDGTEHAFFAYTENGETVYKDQDGLLLTLTFEGNSYVITDLNGTERWFAKASTAGAEPAFLNHIIDKNGNRLSFVGGSNGRYIGAAVVPNGSMLSSYLEFFYNDNGY